MSGTISSKFFWSDWRSDTALRSCSLAARGLWMDMLCIAAEAQPTGYVLVNGRNLTTTDLARLTGAPEADIQSALAELDAAGVFSRDRKGRIYSRRMVRDVKMSQINRKNGKMGGNPSLCYNTQNPQPDNPPDKPPDKPLIPISTSSKKIGYRTESLKPTKESSKTARAPFSEYGFVGQVIRLTHKDLAAWRKTYHAIPDLVAELRTLDGYYAVELSEADQKRWFIRCSAALDKKHQAMIAGARKSSGGLLPNEGVF